MSLTPLKFNQVTSVKLPRSASYIYNNLVQHNDNGHNVSYYAVINGFEVWIIKHSDPEKLSNKDKDEPTVQLRKVPFDKLDCVSCVKWCKFGSTLTFVMGTDSGKIHVYDFEAKKILHSYDVAAKGHSNKMKNAPPPPTVHCVESDGKHTLFVGLSSGALLSFIIDDKGLSDRTLIFQCANNEAINCLTRPRITSHNAHKSNKIYFGCDDGSVLEYDHYTQETDVLIDKSNVNRIYDENKFDDDDGNEMPADEQKYVNNCGACLCMTACDQFVVAGYQSGHIKIVQKSDLSFSIKQVAVHRRMVTAVTVLEGMGMIATASEDGYFHVFRNSMVDSLEVVRSGQFENGILMGIQFVQSKHFSLYDQKYKDRMVIITAYDRNRVAFV